MFEIISEPPGCSVFAWLRRDGREIAALLRDVTTEDIVELRRLLGCELPVSAEDEAAIDAELLRLCD